MISYIFELEDPSADILAAVVIGALAKLAGLTIVALRRKNNFEKIGTVANLYIYPVKSCGVMDKPEADATPVGLCHDGLTDRHWVIFDENDKNIDMKKEPTLTLITCQSVGDVIRLNAPNMSNLDLPKNPHLRKSDLQTKKFYDENVQVVYCGSEAEKWISDFLKRRAVLCFSCPELSTRDAYERKRKWDNTAKEGDVTVFSFLTSYMVASTASLENVNSQLPSPVSMVNFRPNIVVKNEIPFDEDNWREMRIGEHTLFHSVEPCRRCLITTVDPKTAKWDEEKQPLQLLRSYRCRAPYGKAPIFGMYMANDVVGHIKVGDPVYVIRDPSMTATG